MAYLYELYPLSEGRRGDHWQLPGGGVPRNIRGWDEGSYNFCFEGNEIALYAAFPPGRLHPKGITGLYCTTVSPTGQWGPVMEGSAQFAGIVGGSRVAFHRSVSIYPRERTLRAEDFPAYTIAQPGAWAGTPPRVWRIGADYANELRLSSPQVSLRIEFVTTTEPNPSALATINPASFNTTMPAAPTHSFLESLGVQWVLNQPSGDIPRTVNIEQFPLPNVRLWLVQIEWFAVPRKEPA